MTVYLIEILVHGTTWTPFFHGTGLVGYPNEFMIEDVLRKVRERFPEVPANDFRYKLYKSEDEQ